MSTINQHLALDDQLAGIFGSTSGTPALYSDVPQRLKNISHWLVWKFVIRDGKQTKPPFNAKTGAFASTTDPTTWTTFNDAVKAASNSENGWDGIGFVFTDTPLVGVDFDGVYRDGKVEPYVAAILALLDSYTEISPSGNGLKTIIECPNPGLSKALGYRFNLGGHEGIEVYDKNSPRYFTITSNRFSGIEISKIEDFSLPYLLMRQYQNEKFKRLWIADATLWDKTIKSKDDLLAGYYKSQSEADLGLCALLAPLLNYEYARIESAFLASTLGRRDKITGRKDDYLRTTITKAIGNRTPAEVTANEPEPEVHAVANNQPDMSRSVLTGRLGEICEQNLLTDFPVSWAWIALVTAASVLVPEQENGTLHNLYTALIGPVNGGKSQCIEWAVKSLRVSDDPRRYSEVKPGSAERLLKYMNHLQEKGELESRVLMFLDEWKFFFDKAGIENSVFPTLLTTGFYKRDTRILDSHGRPVNVPAAFSWLGGIVTEVYEDCFSRVTALGLYDRFLQGVNPSNYAGFNYRPFDGEQLRQDFEPSSVKIDQSVWGRLKEWRAANPQATREAELALRVAVICSSFDKASVLHARDLDPHLLLAGEQMKLRETFKPNTGETLDAKCAVAVEHYLRANGPAGEWLDFRTMMKAVHYERFGPNVFERAIRGMDSLKIAELNERAPERAPGNKAGRPAKVIRLVPE